MAFPNPLNRVWMDRALEKRPTRQAIKQSYMGLEFFPLHEVYEYTILVDLVKSGNRLAGLYDHQGVPIPGHGYDFESKLMTVMNIMASRILTTETVQKLREAGELSVNNSITKSQRARWLGKVTEALGESEDEVDATVEYLCMQALQGTINWPPRTEAGVTIASRPDYWGNITVALSLGWPAGFIQNATTLTGHGGRTGGLTVWSNAASTPIVDLEVISQYVREQTGLNARGGKVLMSENLLTYLGGNASILEWLKTYNFMGQDGKYADYQMLKDAIQTKLGWNITLYDAQFTYERQSTLGSTSGITEDRIRFLPPSKVIIIPPGVTGGEDAYFATAPDPGPDAGFNTGKYTWSVREERPPWTAEVGIGIHGWPIMKQHGIFVLNALA